MSQPITFRNRQCTFGASIGIAFYDTGHPDGLNTALSGADIALNEAKQAERGRLCLFEDSMRDGTVKLIEVAQEIRYGVNADEFEPHFQPQFNTAPGEILGFEALIRWRHPERGLVPVVDFFTPPKRRG